MKIKIAIVVILLSSQVFSAKFFVGEGPVIGDYGPVHQWEVGEKVFDWWIPVTDPNGNYVLVDVNGISIPNRITCAVNPDRTTGGFEIIDVNEVPRTEYIVDPNIYITVRVGAEFVRYGSYRFGLDSSDLKGNIGMGDFTVEYIDKEPPVYEGGCRKAGE
ncbi:hypothetical protein LCGC14_0434260 [marine sediment metagenome]|uniref:Uncharacterized protein n=1 Tax=marine sediment metagenome TaxID=412755 RepID=A0A0F9V951_9ZZZZ|nr:hypothetical protein [Pricia sp.]